VSEGFVPEEVLALAADYTRDRCRTPMQWSTDPNAGFSPEGVQTWLPVNPNYASGVNVSEQQNDPDSMLNFYKQLLRVRKQTPALIEGDYVPLQETAENYFAFLRRSSESGQSCLVILNLSDQAQEVVFDLDLPNAHCLFSTQWPQGQMVPLRALTIPPFEIFIGELIP
jgi:alpha-glucosidase